MRKISSPPIRGPAATLLRTSAPSSNSLRPDANLDGRDPVAHCVEMNGLHLICAIPCEITG
jgi:hypothetical protein